MIQASQLTFDAPDLTMEAPGYRNEQLITYIGNKRALLQPIESAVQYVRDRLGGRKLTALDAFSGSGVISRLLKSHCYEIYANDLEPYAATVARCYLANRSQEDLDTVRSIVNELNAKAAEGSVVNGFFQELYAPEDDCAVKPGERVFYTTANARRLDFYCQSLAGLDGTTRDLLMGPLLSAASMHANTAGVFKGFYKDRDSGIGKYGGSGSDALKRILAPIRLQVPVLSTFETTNRVLQLDASLLPEICPHVDIAYLDPPYNQHPYGSNYFMLNLVNDYRRPTEISKTSGIPTDWRRSDYNVKSKSLRSFQFLAEAIRAEYLLISFSDEGFISPAEMRTLLSNLGTYLEFRVSHATFRGSRNLRNRNLSVTEHLYLVHKGTR